VSAEKALHHKTRADASDAENLDEAVGGEVQMTSGSPKGQAAAPAN